MSSPRLPTTVKVKTSASIGISLSIEEKKAIAADAMAAGMDVSAYIRWCCAEARQRKEKESEK